MTVRLELYWKDANLRATAERMLQRSPEVVGREDPLSDVDAAKQFLLQRLQGLAALLPTEANRFECFPIYNGYWVNVATASNPRHHMNALVSRVGAGELTLIGTLDSNGGYDTLTIERAANTTATILCDVTFLVDLAK